MNPSASEPVPGRLIVRGARCPTSEATLLVDLIAYTDLGPSARSDDMADTVDIYEMVTLVRNLVGGTPRQLLESMAVASAQALLDGFAAIERIEVRMLKPNPPGLDAAEEIVEVRLSR